MAADIWSALKHRSPAEIGPITVALDDELLARYMATFYGYGSYRGHWWLVGMEEGGGDDESEILTRLALWKARGQRELEDVSMFESSAKTRQMVYPSAATSTNVAQIDPPDAVGE